MVEDAVVDAYTEADQVMGFVTMLQDNLVFPFHTQVLGVPVRVEEVDVTNSGEIAAMCARRHARQAISILELPRPEPAPKGWEWVEAYRYWTNRYR